MGVPFPPLSDLLSICGVGRAAVVRYLWSALSGYGKGEVTIFKYPYWILLLLVFKIITFVTDWLPLGDCG